MLKNGYPGRNAGLFSPGRTLVLCALLLFTGGCSTLPATVLNNKSHLLSTGHCEGCDLRQATFSGLDLKQVHLHGADLSDARFTDAHLEGADLSGTNLQNANFDGASMIGANLRGADLRGVNLIDVRLTGADLRDTDMTDISSDDELDLMDLVGVRLDGARFKDGVTCGGFPKKGGWGCQPE